MTSKIWKLTLASCWFLFLVQENVVGRPLYQLDASQRQVTGLSNLSPSPDCHPDRSTGRVVARTFNAQGTVLQGFTIEGADGQRSYVNVDEEELRHLDMATLGYVVTGLQTLVREGNDLDIRTMSCGAAGRIVMLDAIYSSRAPQTVIARTPKPTPSVAPTLPKAPKPRPFSVFALLTGAGVFLVGIIIVRLFPAESTAAKIIVGIVVAVASSVILYTLGIRDELTLASFALLGGAIIVSVSVFF